MAKVHNFETTWREESSDVINWRIHNFAKVPRVRDEPIASKIFTLLGQNFCLEVFAGGLTGSGDDFVAIMLTKMHHFGHEPPMTFKNISISLCNQLRPKDTLTKSAPENSTIPGPMGVQQPRGRARLGWLDFVKYEDMVDPSNGFFALGEIVIKAEMKSVSKGRMEDVVKPPLSGDTVTKCIHTLFESKSLSDVKLVAGGREFDAHRAILASRSKVFEAIFSTPMTEARTNSVTVEDISAEALQLMLQFIYTDALNKSAVQPALIGDLLKAAKKYEIARLSNLCERIAMHAITLDSVIDWLMLATMLDAQDIKRACMQFIIGRLDEVQLTEGWKRLKADKQIMSEVMPYIVECMCPPAKRPRCDE